MPDTPPEPVARGDRREEVWIEKDRDQVSKVRHTFPTADDAEVTDAVVMPEDSSAWEAREEDDGD